MIRILHVVTDMGRGGLETFLMNYYRAIDRNHIQFDFLMHRSYRSDYDDEIEELGGRIFRIGRLNPFSFHYRSQLRIFFRTHPEYQIIHVHQDCLSGIILKEAKKEGIHVRIAHSHSSSQTKDIKYPIKLLYRPLILRYATHLAACSKAAGDWMFSGASYDLIHNAINASDYKYSITIRNELRQALGIEDDELVIGHVGRFSTVKNHKFLIDVFDDLQKKIKAKLLLVGDGYLRQDIEKQVHDLGLEDSVILTGIREDVNCYLQAMDVFVFPSLYEGLPVTLIEAQAAGLRCLTSDAVPAECNITDLVEQLPLQTSKAEWERKIVNISKYKRSDMYQIIANAGYDININAKELEKYYERLSNTI